MREAELNNWSIVGVICLCIGILLLVAGVGLGAQAASAIDPYGSFLGSYAAQLRNTLFMEKATPYLIGSAVMIIVGVVGLFAGSSQAGKSISPQAPVGGPSIQKVKCPSCGRYMMYVAEQQRWYCPEEKFYL